jgi:hypothetical protein
MGIATTNRAFVPPSRCSASLWGGSSCSACPRWFRTRLPHQPVEPRSCVPTLASLPHHPAGGCNNVGQAQRRADVAEFCGDNSSRERAGRTLHSIAGVGYRLFGNEAKCRPCRSPAGTSRPDDSAARIGSAAVQQALRGSNQRAVRELSWQKHLTPWNTSLAHNGVWVGVEFCYTTSRAACGGRGSMHR